MTFSLFLLRTNILNKRRTCRQLYRQLHYLKLKSFNYLKGIHNIQSLENTVKQEESILILSLTCYLCVCGYLQTCLWLSIFFCGHHFNIYKRIGGQGQSTFYTWTQPRHNPECQ